MMALRPWLAISSIFFSLFSQGCNEQSLARQSSKLFITPLPTAGQELLEEPTVGIQLGKIPLFGIGTAKFELKNGAYGTLRINETAVKSSTGGIFTILTPPPEELLGEETAEMIIQFTPEQDELEGVGIIELQTNAGPDQNAIYTVEVRGTGLFIGDPKLVVSYGGLDFPVASQCETSATGLTDCTLDPLDFGNIPIGERVTQPIKLKNVPTEGTCKLPDLPNGEPDCTPACVITINTNPDAFNLGVGLTPADTGFSIVGGTSLPFKLSPSNDACPEQDDTLNLLRGELTLLLDFAGAQEESDHATTLVIESDAPNAEQIQIPVSAKVREAPVAVAKLRECTPETVGECTDLESVEPLMRVYLDGTESFDPNGGTIASYAWEVIDYPPGSDVELFQISGQNTEFFSFWLPLAGPYKIKLTVTNDLGVPSAETETSIVEVTALPDSRLHVQIVWDSPTADLDLHFVYANQDSSRKEAYHAKWDCYWRSCRPTCEDCEDPIRWFDTHEAFEGPNPRLDIDDTNGFGPENTNIDAPNDGQYHLYIHYYGIGNGDVVEDTNATIRIFGDGVLMAEFNRTLAKNDLWAIAAINWSTDGTSVVTPAQADGEGVIGSVIELNYLPPNGEGFFIGDIFQ